MKRIGIIRLSSLGDIVHTVPAVWAIKKKIPDSWIVWFVEPPGDKLLENFQGIDAIAPVKLKHQGIFKAWKNTLALRKEWGHDFDFLIDFQGLIKSAVFSRFFSGNHLGFAKENLRETMAVWLYDHRSTPFDETRHVIYKNLHLLAGLGIRELEVSYPLHPLNPSAVLCEFLQRQGLKLHAYVVVNVGGGWPTKILSAEKWIEVILQANDCGPFILVWGNEEERLRAEQISHISGAAVVPFLQFSDLLYFIQQAALLVSADTLPLHLADAVHTPSLGLFGPTSPQRNGSLLDKSHFLQEEMDCQYCYRRRCDTIRCMNALTPAKITEKIRWILKNNR